MIAEISASFGAIKQAVDLVKVINEAKGEAEIRNATFHLQSQLLSLQGESIKLAQLLSSQIDEIASLKAKIAERCDMQATMEQYSPKKMQSGSIVFVTNIDIDGKTEPQYACPHCFLKKQVSILQPKQIGMYESFEQRICPSCKNIFDMDKAR